MKTENLSTLQIHKLSREQYAKALDAGQISETALYLTPDESADMAQYATIAQLDEHNSGTDSHNELRLLVEELKTRLNDLVDTDDESFDQLSELLAYINSNKSLIDDITTKKVNVADIIDNVTTNVPNKPLSAAQGVALKALIDSKLAPADEVSTNTVPKFMGNNLVGNSNVTDDGSTITLGTKVVVKGNGSSYNEGIRVLPSENKWSNIFFSADTTTSGNHEGGWLAGRRGQVGTKCGEIGDFTIEHNDSSGAGLTLHKNGDMSTYGSKITMGANKVSMQYDAANECLNFVFN